MDSNIIAMRVKPILLALGLGIAPLGALTPQGQAQTYQHLIIYGQSLSTGQQSWPPISSNAVSNNFMLGQQVWSNLGNPIGSTPPPLSPLVANVAASDSGLAHNYSSQITCECPIVGAANHIQLKTAGQYNFIASSCGTGGTTIEQLSKEFYSPAYYANFSNTLRAAYSVATSIHCPAIFWMQGEYNYLGVGPGLTLGSTCTTSKDSYKGLLMNLKSNMQSDIMAKYQQPDKPILITYQVGAQYTAGTTLPIGMAQLEAANTNSDIVCAGPVYQLPNRAGHRDPNGYRWYGEMLGKAYYRTVIQQQKFMPLQPKQIARTANANVLEIQFLVPQLPLVLDTNLVAPVNKYGFQVFTNNVAVTITSVAINSNKVVLTCASPLTGSVQVVYAGQNNSGAGNLRDSDNDQAYYHYVNLDAMTNGGYVYPRSSGSLLPIYEPKDTNGAVIYNQPYPLYNFSVAFYYSLNATQQVYQVPLAGAQYTASPTTGLAPLHVQFNGPVTDSGGNAITSWNWSFGDGTSCTLQNPAHLYTTVNSFSPSLVVTNNLGVAITGFGPSITTIRSQLHITSASLAGAVFVITFTASTTDVPSQFTLVGTTNLVWPMTNLIPADIISVSPPGTFQATIPASGNLNFYRVRQ